MNSKGSRTHTDDEQYRQPLPRTPLTFDQAIDAVKEAIIKEAASRGIEARALEYGGVTVNAGTPKQLYVGGSGRSHVRHSGWKIAVHSKVYKAARHWPVSTDGHAVKVNAKAIIDRCVELSKDELASIAMTKKRQELIDGNEPDRQRLDALATNVGARVTSYASPGLHGLSYHLYLSGDATKIERAIAIIAQLKELQS